MTVKLKRIDVLAKCPTCERSHVVSIRWTGRGTPRIRCRSCRSVASTYARLDMICDPPRSAISMTPTNDLEEVLRHADLSSV